MFVVVENKRIAVSNPDKLLFTEPPVTKKALVEYYVKIASHMVPHVRNRMCSLRRFPDGINTDGFFQKNISDYFPEWLESVSVPKEGGVVRHLVCNDSRSLAYIGSQACVELHVSLSRRDAVNQPDRIVFDLDPPRTDASSPDSLDQWSTGALAAKKAARKVRALLESMSLRCFLMTTGSAGYHVVVPLHPEYTFDETRAFARRCAEQLAVANPRELTTETRIVDREDRVFIDYLRNAFGQTTIAPYSLRARRGAPVATPITWRELSRTPPNRFNIGNIFRRLAQREDPWANIAGHAQYLPDQVPGEIPRRSLRQR